MAVKPVRLNAAIAWLFIMGAALFVLGSVPAYANAVGATADSVTYFVGSIFFTAASFAQLLQSQTPAMTDVDAESQYLPRLSDLGPGCLMIAIGSQPSPSFPARCVSTSALSRPWHTTSRSTRRTGAYGALTSTDRHCSWWQASSRFSQWDAC